ncbi:MAG: bifunctional diaminohydroxyphosphoribosylaminopyrimidine deaminase/5-amino-6-(5-phosphoribosylamino)uracil reductase RibD [Deltaproteobacteria bacterium]|nr:bifunctional diaminohydroxyphosphoribosylaminopyrimidine deaminase/5-amino-6-(5-phosphoribosylamino)uracil reductase RibD [Deltaproteobacteria bacterium]
MNRDQDFMAIAITLAQRGIGKTSPNPAVGSVIVKNDRIIGSGFHKKAGMPHAEREALDKIVGTPLQNATLYVTLEPCCHYGRTPPCTEAIIQSGIRRVIVGMRDPDRRVSGKGIQILERSGIEVKVGVLEEECHKLNEAYLVHRTKRRPYVILKAAMTLNAVVGLKTKKGGRALAITGTKARRFSHHLRSEVDAILVGSGTVLADDPQLTCRLKRRQKRDPLRVVLDSSLRLPTTSRLFHLKSPAKTLVATTVSKTPKREGVEFLLCRRNKRGGIQLNDLLRQLADRGVMTLLVEGGPKIWSSFLKAGTVDRLVVFIAPKIIQGETVQFPLNQLEDLKSIQGEKIGEDLFIEGSF